MATEIYVDGELRKRLFPYAQTSWVKITPVDIYHVDSQGNTLLHLIAGRMSYRHDLKGPKFSPLENPLTLLLAMGADPLLKNGNGDDPYILMAREEFQSTRAGRNPFAWIMSKGGKGDDNLALSNAYANAVVAKFQTDVRNATTPQALERILAELHALSDKVARNDYTNQRIKDIEQNYINTGISKQQAKRDSLLELRLEDIDPIPSLFIHYKKEVPLPTIESLLDMALQRHIISEAIYQQYKTKFKQSPEPIDYTDELAELSALQQDPKILRRCDERWDEGDYPITIDSAEEALNFFQVPRLKCTELKVWGIGGFGVGGYYFQGIEQTQEESHENILRILAHALKGNTRITSLEVSEITTPDRIQLLFLKALATSAVTSLTLRKMQMPPESIRLLIDLLNKSIKSLSLIDQDGHTVIEIAKALG
ncbi:MAG UNVERIFIED_CONTAM: hypothetical protein LVQ98_07615 [Rickettsiaceae bacterium]|jgi:hypothetical protein